MSHSVCAFLIPKIKEGARRVAKLTDKQKKIIVAAYASGAATAPELAKEYGVSAMTVYRVIEADPDFVKKCEEIKNEAENEAAETLREYFANNQKHGRNLVSRLLNIPDELIDASSLRERVGAAHYVKEMFLGKDGADAAAETEPINITLTVQDLSKGAPDA